MLNYKTLTAQDYSLVGKIISGADMLFLCDTTDGAFTITLPDSNAVNGFMFMFKLKTGSYDVTINLSNNQTADTLSNITLLDVGDIVWLYPGVSGYEVLSVTRGTALNDSIAAL
jgi:hypothetical protein